MVPCSLPQHPRGFESQADAPAASAYHADMPYMGGRLWILALKPRKPQKANLAKQTLELTVIVHYSLKSNGISALT